MCYRISGHGFRRLSAGLEGSAGGRGLDWDFWQIFQGIRGDAKRRDEDGGQLEGRLEKGFGQDDRGRRDRQPVGGGAPAPGGERREVLDGGEAGDRYSAADGKRRCQGGDACDGAGALCL